ELAVEDVRVPSASAAALGRRDPDELAVADSRAEGDQAADTERPIASVRDGELDGQEAPGNDPSRGSSGLREPLPDQDAGQIPGVVAVPPADRSGDSSGRPGGGAGGRQRLPAGVTGRATADGGIGQPADLAAV